MKLKAYLILFTVGILISSCNSNEEAMQKLQGQVEEQTQLMNDTVIFYLDSIAELNYMLDSIMNPKVSEAPSAKTSSTTTKTTPPPAAPAKDPGKVDVTKKGESVKSTVKEVDVTKKGGSTSGDRSDKKVDVTKKGGGN